MTQKLKDNLISQLKEENKLLVIKNNELTAKNSELSSNNNLLASNLKDTKKKLKEVSVLASNYKNTLNGIEDYLEGLNGVPIEPITYVKILNYLLGILRGKNE